MAMDGSDSHGDADALAEYHFGPDFEEYVLKEQLKWSRYKQNFGQWVFWSEQDHEIEPSLSLDNCADFNLNVCAIPKVRDNIRRSLQKLMQSNPWFYRCLVQFWAATKILEGRTLLTTRSEPFALGGAIDPRDRVRLCNYRMEMCRKYNCFYADEEQLGLPGRVFLHQFPEYIPKVECYTTKEYPQRNLALRSDISGSWAMPVFEHSSQTCVGVLEIVSWRHSYWYGLDGIFSTDVNKILQELGLQCFNGYPACEEESREKGKRVKGLAQALEELKMVLSSVCKTHELPLAMTWVPCSACNGLRRCEVSFTDVEFYLRRDHHLDEFLKASKRSHLRKGLVAGRACSAPNMLYCSDISQLSLYDYPLVPYARLCKLSGWFTIYLQNVHTGNDIYVLEFFLSAMNKNDENTTLSYILGTMEEKFETFRFASGKVLGELTSVEVIYFQNGQKIHSDERIQATRDFSLSSIPSSVQSPASVANKRPSFQDANMVKIHSVERIQATEDFSLSSIPSSVQSPASVANKRPSFQDANVVKIHSAERIQATGDFSLSSIPSSVQSSTNVANKRPRFQGANMVTSKAKYDPNSNSFSNFDSDSDPSFGQSSTSVANTRPGFQNSNMVIIIAEYASIEKVFELSLPLPCRLVELQQEVTKRLMLEAGNYSVTYEDEEDGRVLINCDEDLQTYVDDSMSQGDTPRVVLLELKEPPTNLNPTN